MAWKPYTKRAKCGRYLVYENTTVGKLMMVCESPSYSNVAINKGSLKLFWRLPYGPNDQSAKIIRIRNIDKAHNDLPLAKFPELGVQWCPGKDGKEDSEFCLVDIEFNPVNYKVNEPMEEDSSEEPEDDLFNSFASKPANGNGKPSSDTFNDKLWMEVRVKSPNWKLLVHKMDAPPYMHGWGNPDVGKIATDPWLKEQGICIGINPETHEYVAMRTSL